MPPVRVRCGAGLADLRADLPGAVYTVLCAHRAGRGAAGFFGAGAHPGGGKGNAGGSGSPVAPIPAGERIFGRGRAVPPGPGVESDSPCGRGEQRKSINKLIAK